MVKKHMIDCDNELWKEVSKYKIDNELQNINKAVINLIKLGLKVKKNE